ncbi:MAG: GNAT family N-acetyltransferase [Synergistales bacterium]|jgi:ribosomal protein S18 acetylase RimI-like enzyme|nr:GNAT family N-acetyltransferase [Synergistales bacterium]
MDIRSLGYRTDLIFPRFDGEVLDRGDYLVILTPRNPSFFWGNFVLFPDPPGESDLRRWKDVFDEEIRSRLKVGHYAFGWDGVEGVMGEIGPFEKEGFSLNRFAVLVADRVEAPRKYDRSVVVRPLQGDDEWEEATWNQIACCDPCFNLENYKVFKFEQMSRYRKMVVSGLGSWFGAFLEGKLVADLGIFSTERLGRFQNVETHPAYRRRGICGALVHQAGLFAFERMEIETLVMVADKDYHAVDIYQSVGFLPKESQVGAFWWEKETK